MGFWTGTKGKFSQRSTLGPEQQGLYDQLLRAAQGKSSKGSFGQAGQYYRDLLSNDSDTYDAMQAPELRRFREETIPELSEQFAGMGSGGLSSSGFRNAAVNAGTDLSERLGAIRAQLRQQGAQGLQSLGQQGLQPTNENIYTAGQPGALQGLFSGIGSGLGMAGGAALGGGLSSGLNGFGSLFGQSKQQPSLAPNIGGGSFNPTAGGGMGQYNFNSPLR